VCVCVCVCVCKNIDQSDVSVVGANLVLQLHGFNERVRSAWIGGTVYSKQVYRSCCREKGFE
jgi:hypothetical protein